MKKRFEALYQARRAALEAEAAVFDVENEAELVPIFSLAIDEARAEKARSEQSFRLQVLADLLARVEDAGALRLLIGILNERDPSVRARAAMAIGRAHPAYFVRAVEDALEEQEAGPWLLELPGLLLDVWGGEGVPPLEILVKLLDSADADVAAEAACAIGEIDAPGARELLASFRDDERPLSDAAEGPATLGELVAQVLDTLALADDVDA